jgi:hypothetical protein
MQAEKTGDLPGCYRLFFAFLYEYPIAVGKVVDLFPVANFFED